MIYYGRCAVERITAEEEADGTLTFSSMLTQTVVFNDNGYETGEDYKSEKARVEQYRSPCWGKGKRTSRTSSPRNSTRCV